MATDIKVGSYFHVRGLGRVLKFDVRYLFVRFQGQVQGLCRNRQALGCPLGDLEMIFFLNI